MRGRSGFALVLLSALALSPTAARAGFPGEVPERFQLRLSGTAASMDTQAGLGNSTGGLGAMLVFEDLFNLPVHQLFVTANGAWKFGERSYLDVGYINIQRTAQRQIEETFDFGDLEFNAGAVVEASFRSRFIYFAYRHAFLQLEQVKISGTVGVSASRLQATLAANAGVSDSSGTPIVGEASRESTFPVPVPLLGLQLDWATSPRSEVHFYTRAFALDFDKLRGSMMQTSVGYHYFVTPNVGLGIGYDKIVLNLPKYETDTYTARFNYNVQGFSLYLTGAF